MPGRRRPEVEFRYYEIPQGEQVLALLGSDWVRVYGEENVHLHFHNLMEIGYCIDGNGTVTVDDKFVDYEPGMLTVMPVNFPHSTTSRNGNVSAWEYIFLDPEKILRDTYPEDEIFVMRILEKLNSKATYFYKGQADELTTVVRLIMDECRYKKSYSLESIKGLLLTMIMLIARSATENEVAPRHVDKGGIGQINGALSYIDAHYMDEVKTEDLASVCNLSETHFRRLFVEYMNMTPSDYLMLVRIQRACDLMKKTRLTMQEIAERVGYPTISTFNRNFKKIVGTSPYQYKKNSANYEGKLLDYKITAKKGW